MAAYVKNLRPEIRVIGVEPVDSDAMRRSIMAGHRVELKDVGLFADGVAVKLVGEETFVLCRDLLDDIITVDTDAICGAIKDIFEDTRVVAEPAGALALAGLRAYARAGNLRDTTLVAVVSGANMNFDRLSHVAERARFGANREAPAGRDHPREGGQLPPAGAGHQQPQHHRAVHPLRRPGQRPCAGGHRHQEQRRGGLRAGRPAGRRFYRPRPHGQRTGQAAPAPWWAATRPRCTTNA